MRVYLIYRHLNIQSLHKLDRCNPQIAALTCPLYDSSGWSTQGTLTLADICTDTNTDIISVGYSDTDISTDINIGVPLIIMCAGTASVVTV